MDLFDAAGKGDAAKVQALLEAGADVNTRQGNFQTPLHRACAEGHLQVVRLLLDNWANPFVRDGANFTPLHWAAGRGHPPVVKALLANGADVHTQGYWGQTPLLHVAGNGTPEVLAILVQAGADLNAPDRAGEQPWVYAAGKFQRLIQWRLGTLQLEHPLGRTWADDPRVLEGEACLDLILAQPATRVKSMYPDKGWIPAVLNKLSNKRRHQRAADTAALGLLLDNGLLVDRSPGQPQNLVRRFQAVMGHLPPELQALVAIRGAGGRTSTVQPSQFRASALHLCGLSGGRKK